MIKQTKPHHRAPIHPGRQAIALISEHGDPAAELGRDAAGGQNVYVRQVGEALAKLGWQVDLFTRKTDPNQPTIVQHQPHCRTIRLTAGPETYIPRDELFEYMPDFVKAFQKFQAKDGGNYPLIHTNYWMSGWVGLQLKASHGIQLTHTYHSLGAIKYAALSERPAIAKRRMDVERQILEQSDCVVATSPQELDQLRSFVSHKGNIEVIPCGTDTQIFRQLPQSDARSQLGLSETEKIVLYVGRFDPRKGIETLVRSFAKVATANTITPLRLVIVGGSHTDQADNWEQARIQQLVQELGIADQTTFVGAVSHERLPLFYTAADVCVIPSHYEPFGLVAIEAMACGTPVIASNVGGLKFTVVPDETGLLVPPQDIDGFAIAIEQVLNREDWSAQASTKAAHWVQENFSWTGVAAQLSELYRWQLASSLVGPSQSRTLRFASAPVRLSA
jgi:glycosyltransferase involved in cell wall biosynthesis